LRGRSYSCSVRHTYCSCRAKAKQIKNVIRNRLERWRAGEKSSLWKGIPAKPMRRAAGELTGKLKMRHHQEVCIAYTQNGMPGKAFDRLVGSSFAADTDAVYAKMEAKFVPAPPRQHASRRPPAPEANELSQTAVAKSILSFNRGLGAGLSGTRPDFVRQVIGEKGDKPGLPIITQLCNVLADGLAPDELRPYIGGANGFALTKDQKTAAAELAEASSNGMVASGQDVRPVC